LRLVAAVAVPLLLLGILELALRLLGVGYPTSYFVKNPVPEQRTLVENRQFSRRYFSKDLMRVPKPLAFAPVKPSQTLRVFVFGESAAEGDPAPPFGFARIAQVLLRDRYPDRNIELINTAATAINSHVVRPIAHECANYSGDVWVIYMGNNEVVGPFGSGTIFGAQTPSLPLIRANIALKATKLGQLMEGAVEAVGQRKYPRAWEGMEMFLNQQVRQADPRMAKVYSHFQRNLADIVALGVRSGAKIVLSTVGSNLRDCAPLASLHRAGLPPDKLLEWTTRYELGMAREQAGKFADAALQYQQAAELDDQFADLQFRWARCSAALGQNEEARRRFVLARDFDALRFRADSRINEIIRQVAEEWQPRGVRLADVEATLARESSDGIPGAQWFYEHVHLTFPGNYQVARQIVEQVISQLPKAEPAVHGEAAKPLLSLEECARRLGLTDWDRWQMAEEMLRRTSRAPFTNQLDHAADTARRKEIVTELSDRDRTNFPAAITIYQQALAANGGDWQPHDNFAGALLQHGDQTNAVEQWRVVAQLLPHRVQTYDLMGSIWFEQNRLDEAEGAYRQALRIQPDFVDGLIGLGRIRLSQKRGDEAISQFRRAARLQPRLARPQNHLGVAWLQIGETEKAEQAFREALRVEPDFQPARLNLGRVFAKAGKLDDAIKEYADAVQQDPQAFDARDNLANALIRQNRLAEAAPHLAAAVRLRPGAFEVRLNYGTILARQQKTAEAAEQFAEALRIKPDFVPAHLNLAIALRSQNRSLEAVTHLEEVLRLEPGNTTAKRLLGREPGR
jgi:tetratricopeptide (TPR) repeat protein